MEVLFEHFKRLFFTGCSGADNICLKTLSLHAVKKKKDNNKTKRVLYAG